MYRIKQLLGGSLTLRDYDGQVAEAMAMVRALNKMTKAGIPESVRIAWKHNQLQGHSPRIWFIQQRHAAAVRGSVAEEIEGRIEREKPPYGWLFRY